MTAIAFLILLVIAICHWPGFFLALLVIMWLLTPQRKTTVEGCFAYRPTPPVPVRPSLQLERYPATTPLRLPGDKQVHWKYRLAEQVLTKNVRAWRKRFDELLTQPRAAGLGEPFYDEYAADAVRQLSCWVTMLRMNFAALGNAWDTNNEDAIREACDGIRFSCQQLYEWTAKMRALRPYSWQLIEHAQRERMAEAVFQQLEQTVKVLHDTMYHPACTGTVTLNANFCAPIDPQFS